MSEMLGNRYFIARQFDKAIHQLEEAIAHSQNPDKVKKKLIICYVQTGNIDRALHFFLDLVKKDPQIIVDTDPYYDDCPCNELIPLWDQKLASEPSNTNYHMVLGILNLYCDIHESIDHFKAAQKISSYQNIVFSILKQLTEFTQIVK
jgi:tetratricopeptide (TPR) repeat protein